MRGGTGVGPSGRHLKYEVIDEAGLVPGAALTVVRKEGGAVVVALGGAPAVRLGAEQAGAITVRLAGAD